MPRNSKHIKGDQAELIAQEYFIKKGYSVFKNISAQGWKVNRSPSKEQDLLGVHLCYVNLDTREVLDKMPNKQKHKNNIVDIREWKK